MSKTRSKESAAGAAAASPDVAIQLLVEAGDWPSPEELEELASTVVDAVLAELGIATAISELSLVFTDDRRMRALNAGWRDKDKPTNVLSFPAFPAAKNGMIAPMLGDIVLAFETVSSEAALEQKPFEHHVCHLLAHGLLHLLGYDHETEAEAEEMEALERRILARLAISDPYA